MGLAAAMYGPPALEDEGNTAPCAADLRSAGRSYDFIVGFVDMYVGLGRHVV